MLTYLYNPVGHYLMELPDYLKSDTVTQCWVCLSVCNSKGPPIKQITLLLTEGTYMLKSESPEDMTVFNIYLYNYFVIL